VFKEKQKKSQIKKNKQTSSNKLRLKQKKRRETSLC